MDLEHHQLDLRYEALRRRWPEREKRLLASLAENGQQEPIVVVDGGGGEQFVVIDGYKRVRGLRQLKADTVAATAWQLSEPDALILERLMRASKGDDAFEQGWLLLELRGRFGLSQELLAQRFDKSPSWISRRLALVEELPPQIQERVRRGQLAPYAAMKHLVPLARANRKACVQLVEALGARAPTSRQVGALCGAWISGDSQQRERLQAQPWLFLKAQEEARALEKAKPPARVLLGDLGAIAAISRRVTLRLKDGLVRRLQPPEQSEVALCLAQAQADTRTLFHLFEKELADARPEPADGHP